MWVQHKEWFQDGVGAHVVSIGLDQVVFTDAAEGVLDVRNRHHLESLLRHPSKQYALAYARYGVAWDASGQEVTATPATPSVSVGRTDASPPEVVTQTPGRPKKTR